MKLTGPETRQRLRRVARLMVTPMLPEDYLDLVNPLRSGADLRGRIDEVIRETADTATLVIRPGRDWLPHTPGQYLRIGVDVDGVRQWRTYSLTSLPRPVDGRLRITVKAMPNGLVSTHLVRHAGAGTLVQLGQATGDFVLPKVLTAKILFVTGGSGITPVMGILRSLADRVLHDPALRERLPDIVVVHSAPSPADVIFAMDLAALARQGLIRLVLIHTDSDGMLTRERLQELVPDLAERSAWACGPDGLVALMDGLAADGQVAGLVVERFALPVSRIGSGGTATFAASGVSVEVPAGTSLLNAGEAAGVVMTSGCRMGICFCCVVPLTEGAVTDIRTGEVTSAHERADGVKVQTCINSSAGHCTLDI